LVSLVGFLLQPGCLTALLIRDPAPSEGTQKGGLNILPGASPHRAWYAGLQYSRGYYGATEYILQHAGAASIIFSHEACHFLNLNLEAPSLQQVSARGAPWESWLTGDSRKQITPPQCPKYNFEIMPCSWLPAAENTARVVTWRVAPSCEKCRARGHPAVGSQLRKMPRAWSPGGRLSAAENAARVVTWRAAPSCGKYRARGHPAGGS
jgi:hypothetical protein